MTLGYCAEGVSHTLGGAPHPDKEPKEDIVRIAPSLHRLGDDRVGCYLVEEAGEVTIIDAGVPAYYGDLVRELAAMSRTIEDVRALVLTHGHSDHIGFAERVRDEHGVPVSIHELDAALARGEVPNPSAGLGQRRLGSLLGFLAWGARRGALRTRTLTQVNVFGSGATLDVPGALEVIGTPGHTPGNTSLLARGLSALFAGDTLSTLIVTTGATGPRVAAFSADPAQALASLERIEAVEADWLLPGHGATWTHGVAGAVQVARENGIGHLAQHR
jgi:glyoxylase-like metal-dependent hydrolase (beta-lactamase superfamily II)